MDTRSLYDEYLITSMVGGFEPVEVASAAGCKVVDAGGNEYLDCFSGIAVTNAGHGHPKVVAAALANIDVMLEEDLPGNAVQRGEQLMRRLRAFQERCPLVGDVRGKGLMIGIELVADARKTPAAKQARQVREVCRETGLLVGVGGSYGNVIRLQPPLVLTEGQAAAAADILEQAIQTVAGR